MRANNVLGILYASSHENTVEALSGPRTMGSIPFGGRYRVVDFLLSAMVNAGISHVLMPTKSNYRSLMDHVGTGKPWDLTRKREGLILLPPFSSGDSKGVYTNRVEAAASILGFIRDADKEYVLLVDGNLVCNPDFGEMLAQHLRSGADITLAAVPGHAPALKNTLLIQTQDTDTLPRVTEIAVTGGDLDGLWAPHILLMRKDLLVSFIERAIDPTVMSFERDLLQENVERLDIRAWTLPNFVTAIDSVETYYNANLALLSTAKRALLFPADRPVYTKVRDEAPTLYGLNSHVQNSLVADGCTIRGEVHDSVIFRGVRIGRGAVVRGSVVMQDSVIGDNAVIENVILDKHVTVAPSSRLSGAARCPYFVPKNTDT
ncbi:MAG: glucose-1-phosphate adenylyltransferase subunit GlgD [Oscillospiraceae bacterium]|jgi:glucose-1-phosphate adenylyltransferase|nr:glucose-1-phosphate adenylyltransferase subunit GlgD [Oscillospiraceae bacterium]